MNADGIQISSSRRTNAAVSASPQIQPTYTERKLRKKAHQEFSNISFQTDALLLSRQEDIVDNINGRYYDRVIDPFLGLCRDVGVKAEKCVILKNSVASDLKRNMALPAGFSLNPDSVGKSYRIIRNLPGLNELTNYLEHRNISSLIKLDNTAICSGIKRLIDRSIVYEALFEATAPRMVMVSVLDDLLSIAAILACKRKGITVTDVQHGKQGKDHILCVDWKNIPKKGAVLLPDFFWVWGDQTKKRMEQSLGDGTLNHRPMIGGNLWLSDNVHREPEKAERRTNFISTGKKYKKRLLVALQPIAEPLNNVLLEAMANAPKDWIWWVRLHRKMRNREQEISELLVKTGANFDVGLATELSLYSLLREADHNLTAWSTVAFEAEAFGCPTTLFHPTALDLLSDEIAEKRFNYADTGSKLLSLLHNSSAAANTNRPLPYIVADREIARRTLFAMLQLRKSKYQKAGFEPISFFKKFIGLQ